MFLGLGPVARYELTTTARRGRFYLARTAYGLCLLYTFTTQFMGFERTFPEGATAEQVRRFTENAFIAFGGIQGFALLALIPALVAGVIADDYQRKTLHYLLASRLTSAEIVLGKLTARLLHVATFVALGIPVVCLLGALWRAQSRECLLRLPGHVHHRALSGGSFDLDFDRGAAAA